MPEIECKGMQAGRIPIRYQLKSLFQMETIGPAILPGDASEGIDVSKWNGDMDYVKAMSANTFFVYVKATQGISAVDLQFNNNRNKLKGLLPWGGYHFLSSGYSGASQANHFCATLGDYPGELPPVLDVELSTVSAIIIKDFCLTVRNTLGMFPIIYTSAYLWTKVYGIDKAWISQNCGLFVAHWGTNTPLLPIGWENYLIHQRSADGNNLGVTYGAPPPPLADSDMDLDRTRKTWLSQYIVPTPPPTLSYPKVEVITDSLNIRSGPSTAYSVIGGLIRGHKPEKLEVVTQGDDIWIRIGWRQWAAMRYNGITYMRDI